MPAHATQAAPPTFFGQLLITALTGYGAYYLYPYARSGLELAIIGALFLGLVAVVSLVKARTALDRLIDRRRRHRRLETFSDVHGKARLGNERDAKKAGLCGSKGLILGRVGKKTLRYAGENAVLVAGRPGSWKGVAFVILNLLMAPKPTKKDFQSFIVTDFSGELYAVTRRRLKQLGYRVIAIASESERLSRELGVPIDAMPHNPAAFLKPDDPLVLDDVKSFAELLHPGVEPSQQNGTTQHFDDLARLLLVTFMLWLLDRYGEVTLPGLRRLVMSSQDEMLCLLEAASESDSLGGALAESASSVLGLMARSPEEFSGMVTTATRAVHLYASGAPVGRQVSEHRFDWGELKREPTVVFIIVPPERLESQASFVNLTISASAEALARVRSHQRVTYLLDEVGNIHIPNLMRIVSLYRKFGLQCVLVVQQLEAQLARVYGKEAARELFSYCGAVLALSTGELEDLKKLSELVGQETTASGSHSLREGDQGEPEVSYQGQYEGRPVIRAEEIRLLEKHRGLMIPANAPPFIVNLINYLQTPQIARLADPNPYYLEQAKGA